jgi:hypothetical protein
MLFSAETTAVETNKKAAIVRWECIVEKNANYKN